MNSKNRERKEKEKMTIAMIISIHKDDETEPVHLIP